jgi:hypothetical protein
MQPWQEKSDADVLDWFKEQDADYRRRIVENAGIWAGDPRPPNETIVQYLRKMSAPACPCGFDGSPTAIHSWDVRKCFSKLPAVLEKDDDDDDLPF